MTKVTVVIPTTQNTLPYCELTVKSLREGGCNWDIIVVVNGSEEKYAPKMQARVVFTKDKGQCNAVNIGAKLASPTTDYLLISNDDMYYPKGWDINLRFDHPVFSPNLVEPTNNNGSAPPFLKFDGGYTLEEFNKEGVDTFINAQVLDPEVIGTETTGLNFPLFIRKDIWGTIGGYDKAYDPWGSNSDTDLQTAIELAGVQPMRLRDVLVYHFSNKSGTFDGTHQDAWQKNWDYYTKKWGFNRDDEPLPDTWMATNMVNKEKNIYHPAWEGKYN